jgi:Sec-independent protein translocase protein TatA
MSAVERFKRALDSVVNELEEERTRPYKKPKLDSAEEQASTNALINKNRLQ